MERKYNVVVIGGGTGSTIVLKGLKKYDEFNLFSIVPMGDSGGSSGRLREDFGVLSAGEIRQRLIALADEQNGRDFIEFLDHRFEKGNGLKGHNFGNILITGLSEFYSSQEKAVESLSKMFNIKGKIIPSTWEKFELVAEYKSGSKIVGEHFIDESSEESGIVKLYTQPSVKANPQAIEAIKNADIIIFGPGDLYTSILHNLVVEGIPQAILKSSSKKIFISNLMTSMGETTGMNLQDLLNELENYIGGKVIDTVLVNSKELPTEIVKEYEKGKQLPINPVLNEDTKSRVKIVKADLLADVAYTQSKSDILQRSILRHDPDKLGALLTFFISDESKKLL